jgi:16S rRNA (cytosine967-C5)-methyltransferase
MPLDPRAAAARAVAGVLEGRSLSASLPPQLEQVAPRDRGLAQELAYGTLRHAPRLQGLLQQLLSRPLKERDRDVQALLLIGLYQLEHTRVPAHAAVNATVAATRTVGKPWARGLTNAVLRRFQREREQLLAGLTAAAAASHPRWLYQALQQQWPAQVADIIAANNGAPPMTLRVNLQKVSRERYLELLAEHDMAATAGGLSPAALRLEQPCDVRRLPGFDQGLASVQDEAAQLAAPLLAPEPGDRVLDACAAPGGKACHILERQPELAGMVAADASADRLLKVRENLARLGLEATLQVMDATAPPPGLGTFDRILADVPCSASGVLRRHPDAKLLRRRDDIAGFAATQVRLLEGLWPLLRPGGRLLYVTCSVLAEENSAVIDTFLRHAPDATAAPLAVTWGEAVDRGRQLLPETDGGDGLFYALLQKQ